VDLRKGFTPITAFRSVQACLEAKLPITNMNLILFHPTALPSDLMITTERTVELLKMSLQKKAKLSVNAFPLLEEYSGSALTKYGKQYNWPQIQDHVEINGKKWVYASSYLPSDESMRGAAEKLLRIFEEYMHDYSSSSRWPKTPVDRNIGVNGLVMFITALDLLGAPLAQQCAVTKQEMEDLMWQLIDTFSSDTKMNIDPK